MPAQQFDPSQPYTVAPSGAGPAPAFDPSQPFTAATEPTFKTINEPPSRSLWEIANAPLIPQIADAAHAIADHLDVPAIHRSKMEAQVRGFLAGATGAAGDVAAGFTSPIGLALSLAGLSSEGALARNVPGLKALLALPAVRTLQKSVQVAGGAAFGAHGAARVVTAPTLGEKAQGAVEAAAGAVGVASGLSRRGPALARPPTPEEAATAWAAREGLPIDAGTATGNRAVQGVQYMADRTLGGSLVATGAERRTAAALKAKGAELADQARGAAVTPEQAGAGIRAALTSKVDAHTALADASYDRLRALEAQPTNQMSFPRPKAPVDTHPAVIQGELRRIVHEMDASGYTGGRLLSDEPGVSSGTHYVPRTGGAKVYHDITEILGHAPGRAGVQEEIEAYLGGGPRTAAVKAALDVATERVKHGGGGAGHVSVPELPESARSVPTRLEGARVTSDEIGLPVDTRPAKEALRPVYDQMRRQMPIAQQQMNPGLKALENILEGPDWAPLSQVDRDLSAIKTIARNSDALAKLAVGHLDRAVQEAAGHGGPEVVHALHQGRQATIAKAQTTNLIDALPGGALQEGGAVFARATAPKDGGIEFLRALQEHTPQAVPQVARALLDDLLAMKPDKMHAEWMKRGAETRKILFPEPGQAAALDHFFRVQQLLQKNMNPSGSGVMAMHVGEVGLALTGNPIAFVSAQVGSAGLSAILHSPRGVRALTKLLGTELAAAKAPAVSAARTARAARAAGWAEVVAAGRDVGVPVTAPPAAAARRE